MCSYSNIKCIIAYAFLSTTMTSFVVFAGFGEKSPDVCSQRGSGSSKRTDQRTDWEELSAGAWKHHPEVGSKSRDTGLVEPATPASGAIFIVMTT